VDNLHVTYRLKRSGVGTRLPGAAAQIALNRRPSRGIYRWVLEHNEAAQSFYQARGSVRVERRVAQAPGGDPARLNGAPVKLRYAWTDPSVLVNPHDTALASFTARSAAGPCHEVRYAARDGIDERDDLAARWSP
jgi:ribosomal protein S18 acetylase RimI-like enzyme